MVRPHRIEYEGAYYHVMNRGQGRRAIYHGAKYYEYFIGCLEQAHTRFAFEVHAYCLMGNHYHLLVRTPRGNLSRAMRHINGVYTQHYNYLKKTDGPLFRGRYKAINIQASSYLLEVSRYIHRNPVETAKPLVKKLESYKWSSYPAYRKKVDTPDWLYKESVFAELGSGQPTASYRRFVDAGIKEETEKFYSKNQWPAVRGSKKFAEYAHAHSNASGLGVRKERVEIDANFILSVVAKRFKCEEKELLTVVRGRGVDNTPRSLAIKLCQEYGSMKLRAIGELFGIGSESGVTKTISRLTARMRQESNLSKHYKKLGEDLTS